MENQTKSYVVVLPTMNEEEFVFIEEEIDDLSHWEFINSSESDSDSNSVSASDFHFDQTTTNTQAVHDDGDGDDDVVDHHESSHDGYVEPHPFHFPTPTVTNFIRMIPGPIQDDGYDHDDDDDQDDDGYLYGYDLDDELVPKSLSGKFGRQRMRKLGKRGFAAKNSSKKSPILFAKPGCVHGKHGLGLKHSF